MPSDRLLGRFPTLDSLFPPRGPCGLCGHRDARHRLWNAMLDRAEKGGETAEEVASDLEYPAASVREVLRVRPYRRGRHHAE